MRYIVYMQSSTKELAKALAEHFNAETAYSWDGKLRLGGGPNNGQVFTLGEARKITGAAAPQRAPRQQRQSAYGEWALVAAINGRLNG